MQMVCNVGVQRTGRGRDPGELVYVERHQQNGDSGNVGLRLPISEPLRVHFGLGSAEKAAWKFAGRAELWARCQAWPRTRWFQDHGRQGDGGAEVRVAAVIYCVPTFGSIFLASAISASASAVFFSCSNASPRL